MCEIQTCNHTDRTDNFLILHEQLTHVSSTCTIHQKLDHICRTDSFLCLHEFVTRVFLVWMVQEILQGNDCRLAFFSQNLLCHSVEFDQYSVIYHQLVLLLLHPAHACFYLYFYFYFVFWQYYIFFFSLVQVQNQNLLRYIDNRCNHRYQLSIQTVLQVLHCGLKNGKNVQFI